MMVIISLILIISPYTLSLKYNMYSMTTNTKLRQLDSYPIKTEDQIYHLMTIPMCIGEPKQCYDLIYDTGISYSILGGPNSNFKHTYDQKQSKTFRSARYNKVFGVPYYSNAFSAIEAADYFVFANQSFPLFSNNFLLVFKSFLNFSADGILGLNGYYPPKNSGFDIDERFSYINYLKFNKLIDKRIFAHEYKSRDKGILYLGETPYPTNKYKQCTSMFFGEDGNYNWNCDVKEIYFDSSSKIPISVRKIAFATGSPNIIAPIKEGTEIFNYIIQESSDKCYIDNKEKGIQKLLCKTSFSISSLSNLNFIFEEDVELKFFYNDMFRLINYNGESLYFYKIIIIESSNQWILGEPVLKNYNMFFSHDDEIVGFIENINFHGENWSFLFLYLVVLVLLIIIAFLIWTHRKRLINKFLREKEIKKINEKDTFEEGHQLGDIE